MTSPSFTIAIGLASWSTTTSALACARSARRMASASGSDDCTGIARRASVRACSEGSRSLILADRSACPALIHMKIATTISHRPYGPPMLKLPSADTVIGASTRTMARMRPAQAAITVAEPALPVSFHSPARSTRPPSSGSPGSMLKIATRRFENTTRSRMACTTPVECTSRSNR